MNLRKTLNIWGWALESWQLLQDCLCHQAFSEMLRPTATLPLSGGTLLCCALRSKDAREVAHNPRKRSCLGRHRLKLLQRPQRLGILPSDKKGCTPNPETRLNTNVPDSTLSNIFVGAQMHPKIFLLPLLILQCLVQSRCTTSVWREGVSEWMVPWLHCSRSQQ